MPCSDTSDCGSPLLTCKSKFCAANSAYNASSLAKCVVSVPPADTIQPTSSTLSPTPLSANTCSSGYECVDDPFDACDAPGGEPNCPGFCVSDCYAKKCASGTSCRLCPGPVPIKTATCLKPKEVCPPVLG